MHQIWTRLTKYLKIQIFETFMQILCTFRKTRWLRRLKTFKTEQISCRGGFFEEIKAIGVEKVHQILTEIGKNTKNSNFEKFMQFLFNLGKPWWLPVSKTFNNG